MGIYRFIVYLMLLCCSSLAVSQQLDASDWRYRVNSVGVQNTPRGTIIETTGQGYRINNPSSTWADTNGAAYRRTTKTLATTARQRQIIRSAIATTRTRPTGHPLVWAALYAGGYLLEQGEWLQSEGIEYPLVQQMPNYVGPLDSHRINTSPCNNVSILDCAQLFSDNRPDMYTGCRLTASRLECMGYNKSIGDAEFLTQCVSDWQSGNQCTSVALSAYLLYTVSSGSYNYDGSPNVLNYAPVNEEDIDITALLDDPLVLYDAIRSPDNVGIGSTNVDAAPYNLDDDTQSALDQAWYDTYQNYVDDNDLDAELGTEPTPDPEAEDISTSDSTEEDSPIPDAPDVEWRVMDIEPSDFSPWADIFANNAVCPADYQTDPIFGETINYSFQPMCDLAIAVRPILLILAYLFAGYMIIRRT